MSDAGVPGQTRTKWGQVVLSLLVGGVLTAICFILNWWWLGTICLLLTLFVACFFFSRALYPLVFTVFAMFAIGWLVGAWLDVALHRGGESAWWRDLVPFVGGIVLGIAVPLLFWFVTLVASSQWILGLPEAHDVEWWKGFAFLATRVFGFFRPFVKVENGEMQIGKAQGAFSQYVEPKLVSKFGGPGLLVVGEGNVVVLERNGEITRILGKGTYTLERGEWFKEPIETKGIHDLRGGGGDPVTVKDVRTKDGVPLKITIGGWCRLELKGDTDKRPASRYAGAESSSPVIAPDSQYPIYEATIRKAVYGTGKGGWQDAFPKGGVGALRDVVAKYTFEQIFPSPGPEDEEGTHQRMVAQMEKEIKEAIGEGPAAKGIVAGGIGIREINPPEEMRKAMLARWAAPLQGAVLRQKAEDARDRLIVQTEGQARSFERIEKARRDASSQWAPIIADLQAVLPQVDNDLAVLEFVRMVRDLLSRIGRDQNADRRRLTALQRMMDEEDRLLAASIPPAQYPTYPPADTLHTDEEAE
jgi:regulator of protease activity HflC (stomatin/prohibitin superfamily)